MKSHAKAMSCALLTCTLAAIFAGRATALDWSANMSSSNAKISLSKSYSVKRGSAEYQAIERFIASKISAYHGAFGTPESLTSNSLGSVIEVKLSYSYGSVSANVVPVPAPNPPWLPNDPNPSAGDTASVHTCSAKAGLDQTWEFTFVSDGKGGGEWVITQYRAITSEAARLVSSQGYGTISEKGHVAD